MESYGIFFNDRIISVSTMSSMSVHVACDRISFLRLNSISEYVFTMFCLSIHQLVGTGLFLVLAMVGNAAWNVKVQISL